MKKLYQDTIEQFVPFGAPPSQMINRAAPFRCDNGETLLRMRHLNDDYCDCKDGSDEPGSSACPGGKFFCCGHFIHSSKVRDKIVDCLCDHSDEASLPSAKNIERSAKDILGEFSNPSVFPKMLLLTLVLIVGCICFYIMRKRRALTVKKVPILY